MGKRKPRTLAMLDESQRRLRIATVALYAISLIVILVVGYLSYTTRTTLCTFRDDLERRADGTRDYLALHPDQEILGVPREVISNNLRNQERTLRSLHGLHC